MKKLKPIIGGALLGTFVFFTGPLIFIVLLLKWIFTPFGMGRMAYARAGYGMNGWMADKIRSMTEEEYNQFKSKMEQRFHGCRNTNQ